MKFVSRNKLSPPPRPMLSDVDRAALRSLVHHPGLYVLLDILQRYAIEAELTLYTEASRMDDEQTLNAVREARTAWLMLDRLQVPLSAVSNGIDEDEAPADDQKVTNPSNDDFLSP